AIGGRFSRRPHFTEGLPCVQAGLWWLAGVLDTSPTRAAASAGPIAYAPDAHWAMMCLRCGSLLSFSLVGAPGDGYGHCLGRFRSPSWYHSRDIDIFTGSEPSCWKAIRLPLAVPRPREGPM